jgi:TonB family protein
MSRHTSDDARFLELLERWQTGAFNHADERELHALAESDDFRREAWEGFSALPETQHEAYLERLYERLRPRSGAKRIVLGMWMAAAAALVLVVAAVFFWPEPTERDAQPIAQSTEVAPVPPGNTPTPTDADTYSKAKPAGPSSGPAAARPRSEPTSGPGDIALQDDVVPATKDKTESKPAESAPEVALDADAAKMVLAEESARPQPAAPPPAASKKAQEQAAGMEKARTTGATPARKATDSAKPVAAIPDSEPVGGWDNFQLYIRRNARLTEAARNNNISGNVRLQFTVGPDGKPANISVLQSLGFGCDEEAMRLVRLFQWTPAGGSATVEVPFVR